MVNLNKVRSIAVMNNLNSESKKIDFKIEEEEEGQLKNRLNELMKTSSHCIIIGSRGEGKTALAFKLLELYDDFKECYVYKYPNPFLLPTFIKNISKIEQLPVNSVLLIDECSNDFDQYSYAKRDNRYLRDLMITARHKNQSFIFVTTTTKFINLNFMYLIDSYFLKTPAIYQREEERKIIKNAYNQITETININEFWYMDNKLFLKGKFIKPMWFNDKLSKAYETYKAEQI